MKTNITICIIVVYKDYLLCTCGEPVSVRCVLNLALAVATLSFSIVFLLAFCNENTVCTTFEVGFIKSLKIAGFVENFLPHNKMNLPKIIQHIEYFKILNAL